MKEEENEENNDGGRPICDTPLLCFTRGHSPSFSKAGFSQLAVNQIFL